MLDLGRLRSFHAIAETGSFSRAARRLGLSQPALSTQIARLEEELGVPLLRRGQRGATPTEAGQRLLIETRSILAEIAAIEARFRRRQTEPAGELRIGSVHSVGIHLLPQAIDLLQQQHPRVQPTLRLEHSHVVLDLFAGGELDIAVTGSARPPATPHHVLLFDDPVVLVCGRRSRFWGRARVEARELDGEPLAAFDQQAPTAALVERVLKQHRTRMRPVIRSTQIEALLRAVELGLGLGFLPLVAVADELRAGRLHALSFASDELHRGIWASWSEGGPHPARDALLTCLRDAVAMRQGRSRATPPTATPTAPAGARAGARALSSRSASRAGSRSGTRRSRSSPRSGSKRG